MDARHREITLEALEIVSINHGPISRVTAILYKSDFDGKITRAARSYPRINLVVRGKRDAPYGVVMGDASIAGLKHTNRGEGHVATGTARKCVTVTFDCVSLGMLDDLEIPAPTTVVFGYRFGMWPPRGAFDEYSSS
jgi:hypothetical protein